MAIELAQLKEHLRIDESTEDSMLSLYLASAKKYILTATGSEPDQLVLIVASIFYEYRVSEEDMKKAFEALTPIIVQEAMLYAPETDQPV